MARLKALTPRIKMLPPRLKPQPHQGAERERIRMRSSPWRAWYKTARWQVLRGEVFVRDLFTCKMCGRVEGKSSQLVCDHVRPHRGDERLFWTPSNLQTLCKPCHDGRKQAEERAAGW